MTATFSCSSRPRVLLAGLLVFLTTACLNFSLRPPLEKAEWGLRKRLVVQGFRSMRLGHSYLAGRAFNLAMTPGALVDRARFSKDGSCGYVCHKLSQVEDLCLSLDNYKDYKGEARLLSRLNKLYGLANKDYWQAETLFRQSQCEELRRHTGRASSFRKESIALCKEILSRDRGNSFEASMLLSYLYLKESRLEEAEVVLADQLSRSLSKKDSCRAFETFQITGILFDRLQPKGAEFTAKRIFSLLEARGNTPDFSTKFLLLRQMQNSYVMNGDNKAAEDTALIIAREVEAHRSGK